MLARLILLFVCAACFVQANDQCKTCRRRIRFLYNLFPLTTCEQNVKDSIQDVKQCLTDIFDGELNCLREELPPPSSRAVIKRGITGLANSLCKGCPVLPTIMQCFREVEDNLRRTHRCSATALNTAMVELQTCAMNKFETNADCLALKPDLQDAMSMIAAFITFDQQQTCRVRGGQGEKRSIGDSFQWFRELLLK